MPKIYSNNQVELTRSDFDSLYQGKPLDGLGMPFAPWDTGEPQQIVIDWHQEGLVTGPVLDAGCGLGHHAVYLAEHGYEVTAFDFSPAAIQSATALAGARGLAPKNPHFVIADATALDLSDRYATVIDSALYHCLTETQRAAYLTGLHRTASPAATLLLACFADTAPQGLPGPFRIGRAELERALPAAGWEISTLREGTYETLFEPRHVLHLAGTAGAPDSDTPPLHVSSRGRILLPVWLVHARATVPGHER